MKLQIINPNEHWTESTRAVEVKDSSSSSSVVISNYSDIVYRELSDQPVERTSDLEMLQMNMVLLADLTQRLGFLNREIKYQLSIK